MGPLAVMRLVPAVRCCWLHACSHGALCVTFYISALEILLHTYLLTIYMCGLCDAFCIVSSLSSACLRFFIVALIIDIVITFISICCWHQSEMLWSSVNRSNRNLKWIVQSTAVTVQRKLKIRKRKRKEICLEFRFKWWQCCRRPDFRGKRVPAGLCRSCCLANGVV